MTPRGRSGVVDTSDVSSCLFQRILRGYSRRLGSYHLAPCKLLDVVCPVLHLQAPGVVPLQDVTLQLPVQLCSFCL